MSGIKNRILVRDSIGRAVAFDWIEGYKQMSILWFSTNVAGGTCYTYWFEWRIRSREACKVWVAENEKRIVDKIGHLDIFRLDNRP